MLVHNGSIHEAVAAEVEKARRSFGPEVLRFRYIMQEDTAGEPAIYFRFVLADWAVFNNKVVNSKALASVTGKIKNVIFDEIQPYEKWGLYPYTSFRADSEMHIDPKWA